MRHGTLTAARSCRCPACTAEQTRYEDIGPGDGGEGYVVERVQAREA